MAISRQPKKQHPKQRQQQQQQQSQSQQATKAQEKQPHARHKKSKVKLEKSLMNDYGKRRGRNKKTTANDQEDEQETTPQDSQLKESSNSEKTKSNEGKDTPKNQGDTSSSQKQNKNNNKDKDETKTEDEEEEDRSTWSTSKKRRMRRKRMLEKAAEEEGINKSKKNKKQKKNEKEEENDKTSNKEKDSDVEKGKRGGEEAEKEEQPPQPKQKPKLAYKSVLQQQFLARLEGSRFRELNEELYTTTSTQALKKFQSQPQLFEQYHEGFRRQVQQWPTNPVDTIFQWLVQYQKKRQKHQSKKSNRTNNKDKDKDHEKGKVLVVADFGCGDAQLAAQLVKIQIPKPSSKSKSSKTMRAFRVHSFDLVKPEDSNSNANTHAHLITACDMANVPLPNHCVDVGVFCLSLMGTNMADFIREAHRVLKVDGILKIVEVQSRFDSSSSSDLDSFMKQGFGKKNGKFKKGQPRNPRKNDDNNNDNGEDKNNDDTLSSLDEFLEKMKLLGFTCSHVDKKTNTMFVFMEFHKEKRVKVPSRKVKFSAKPCIYKRR